jgi:hypothetical protein
MNNNFNYERYNSFIESYLNKDYPSTEEIDLIDKIIQNNYLQGRLDKNLLKKIESSLDLRFNPQNEIIGIAEFPVVNETDSCICSIKIENESEKKNKLDERISNKKELDEIANFIYAEINKNLINVNTKNKDLFILNFNKKFLLGKHLFDNTDFNKLHVDGTSFLFAAVVAFVSNVFKLPINANYIFTGAFDYKGNAVAVNSIDKKYKIIKKERPNTQKIFIPPISLINDNKILDIINSERAIFEEVKDIGTLIEKVFNKTLKEICEIDTDSFIKDYYYVLCKFLEAKDFVLKKEYYDDILIQNKNIEFWTFIGENFDVFPADLSFKHTTNNKDFIILYGKVANIYTGYILAHPYKQSESYFCIKEGKDGGIKIFARPKGDKQYIGYYIDSPEINNLLKN